MLTDVQQQIRHPSLHWMAATLDGRVEKYMAQLQHNMWVVLNGTYARVGAGANCGRGERMHCHKKKAPSRVLLGAAELSPQLRLLGRAAGRRGDGGPLS